MHDVLVARDFTFSVARAGRMQEPPSCRVVRLNPHSGDSARRSADLLLHVVSRIRHRYEVSVQA